MVNAPELTIELEELAVEGMSHADAERLVKLVEQRVAELLAAQPASAASASSVEALRLDVGLLLGSSTRRLEQLADRLARAVHGRLAARSGGQS